MKIRYAALAMTGVNDRSKALKYVDKHPQSWNLFADAKAAVITRAEILCEFLESSACSYQVHSASGEHHYEVSFEYGPLSCDPTLPFKMVLYVDKCTVEHDQIHALEPDY